MSKRRFRIVKQLDQGEVKISESIPKQILNVVEVQALKAVENQQAVDSARRFSRLPRNVRPPQRIIPGIGLAGRKEVQAALLGTDDKASMLKGQKRPTVVIKKDNDVERKTVRTDLTPAKTVAPKATAKKGEDFQMITLENLSIADQKNLAKLLGLGLRELEKKVVSNISGLVIPSEWLSHALSRSAARRTGVLNSNRDRSLPCRIVSKKWWW